MKNLIFLSLFLFFLSCQGGDKTNYNITGPDEVSQGGSVAISVNGDASSKGNYSYDRRTTTTTTKRTTTIQNKKTVNSSMDKPYDAVIDISRPYDNMQFGKPYDGRR